MKRTAIIAGGALGFVGLFYYVFLYPHPLMRVQPNVRPYQARVPHTPAGTVPVHAPAPVPVLERSAQSEAWGKVYYGYYCLACHGANGDGDGPVGQSYVPVPTDLRSPTVQAYSNEELLKKMLTGMGHETPLTGAPPNRRTVLQQVVPPEHRWPLLWYVRTFAPATRPE